ITRSDTSAAGRGGAGSAVLEAKPHIGRSDACFGANVLAVCTKSSKDAAGAVEIETRRNECHVGGRKGIQGSILIPERHIAEVLHLRGGGVDVEAVLVAE